MSADTPAPFGLADDLWHAIDGCLKNLGTDVSNGDETHWSAGWRKGRSQVVIAVRDAIQPVITKALIDQFANTPEDAALYEAHRGEADDPDDRPTLAEATRDECEHDNLHEDSRVVWVCDDCGAVVCDD